MGRVNQIRSINRRAAAGFAALMFAGFTSQVQAQGSVADGQTLYNDTCAGCHFVPPNASARRATTVTALNNAMNDQPSMNFLRPVLSADDVCNIVTYIASIASAAAPNCSTGVTKNNLVLRSTSTTNPQISIGKFSNNVLQFSTMEDPGAGTRLVAIGDFDRSGRPDLAFQGPPAGAFGDIKSWNQFSASNEFLWRQVKTVWDVQAVGDMDGDGVEDLVWRYMAPDPQDTGVSFIWFLSGNFPGTPGTPVVPQPRKRGGAPLDWQLLGALDINNDGAADMLYLNPAGQFRFLMATPARTCANFASSNIPAGFTPLKFAKFRGGTGANSSAEVLIRNAAGATQLLSFSAVGLTLPTFTGNPDDPLVACTSTPLTVPMTTFTLPTLIDPAWTFYAAADLDNNGTVDIVWRRPTGQLTVWLMNANGTLSTSLASAGTAPVGFTVMQNGFPLN
jgi:hypothetical protein